MSEISFFWGMMTSSSLSSLSHGHELGLDLVQLLFLDLEVLDLLLELLPLGPERR